MINQITDLFSPLFWIINSPLNNGDYVEIGHAFQIDILTADLDGRKMAGQSEYRADQISILQFEKFNQRWIRIEMVARAVLNHLTAD